MSLEKFENKDDPHTPNFQFDGMLQGVYQQQHQ